MAGNPGQRLIVYVRHCRWTLSAYQPPLPLRSMLLMVYGRSYLTICGGSSLSHLLGWQLRQALQEHNPHHSTNIAITHMIGWCAWTGGLGIMQSDIQGALGKLPTLRSLHRLVSEGQPFSIVSREAVVHEQVLVELCERINHHALALTRHLQDLPQDLSEAGRLARMFAWTRKRVKMTESFLVLTGAVVATLPQFGASAPVNTYAGAGMTLLGGLKVVWQHFAEDPNGSAAAYESGQSATDALRHYGTKLLIAWLELFGVVELLVDRAKSDTPLTNAEEEQIRDFFVSFHKHPSKDDISKVYTTSEQSLAKKYPNLKEQYDNRYAVPSAKRFPYPHRLQPTVEESASSSAASSSRRDQTNRRYKRRPNQGPGYHV
ncbi:hypothetical protein EV714DRAFT_237358 [Schizophyllum commune]